MRSRKLRKRRTMKRSKNMKGRHKRRYSNKRRTRKTRRKTSRKTRMKGGDGLLPLNVPPYVRQPGIQYHAPGGWVNALEEAGEKVRRSGAGALANWYPHRGNTYGSLESQAETVVEVFLASRRPRVQ